MGLLHILRGPVTPTTEEREQLAALDRYQRRYLAGRICGLCEQPLDRVGCGGYMALDGEWPPKACEQSLRIDRRARCLLNYKPRLGRRKPK